MKAELCNMQLNEENALEQFESAARSLTPYPGGFSGKGIVICGGGTKYFPCAWVCINRLRDLGCDLPIELWHLGRRELSPTMEALVGPLGVRCVDGLAPSAKRPLRRVGGYQLKAYAILHSSFEEVLLLDADNVTVVDPRFLWKTDEYQKSGAVFWPDYGKLAADRPIWRLTGVPHREEWEFESGQILVDKPRCWPALKLALWMNQHSEFWYRYIHGDKDTFHMAWRKLGLHYAMPDTPCYSLSCTMCQHDFEGRRIFQHRNFDKWTLDDPNPRFDGFIDEELCLAHLERLRVLWTDRPKRDFDVTTASVQVKQIAQHLCAQQWIYSRIGFDQRPMSFSLDGRVAHGMSSHERGWNVEEWHSGPVLSIHGKGGLTCLLQRKSQTQWRGQWTIGECMAVELCSGSSDLCRENVDAST
jgi:hypothetical protein